MASGYVLCDPRRPSKIDALLSYAGDWWKCQDGSVLNYRHAVDAAMDFGSADRKSQILYISKPQRLLPEPWSDFSRSFPICTSFLVLKLKNESNRLLWTLTGLLTVPAAVQSRLEWSSVMPTIQ